MLIPYPRHPDCRAPQTFLRGEPCGWERLWSPRCPGELVPACPVGAGHRGDERRRARAADRVTPGRCWVDAQPAWDVPSAAVVRRRLQAAVSPFWHQPRHFSAQTRSAASLAAPPPQHRITGFRGEQHNGPLAESKLPTDAAAGEALVLCRQHLRALARPALGVGPAALHAPLVDGREDGWLDGMVHGGIIPGSAGQGGERRHATGHYAPVPPRQSRESATPPRP